MISPTVWFYDRSCYSFQGTRDLFAQRGTYSSRGDSLVMSEFRRRECPNDVTSWTVPEVKRPNQSIWRLRILKYDKGQHSTLTPVGAPE